MAEYVYQNLETMLPELEEMERVGIFSKQEIKLIVKRRTAFEYKLQRKIAQEVDFLRYIQYELNLDLLRKKRKQKYGIQKKVLPGEVIFIRRLHQVFQAALKKFSSDVKLWLQYIDFCKSKGSNQVLGKVVGRMLQAHPNNTDLWVMAAKWEFEDKSNIESARSLMQRALRLNPNSKELWLEYFRLELLHVDKVKKRRKLLGIGHDNVDDQDEPSSTDFLSGKTATIVYKNAIRNIPGDIGFHLKFVDIYNLFEDTDEGIDEVFQRLFQDFSNCEMYWNALAHRGFNKIKTLKGSLSSLPGEQRTKLETERNEVFEKAIKELPTEKMWGFYIDACMNDLKSSGSKKAINDVLELFTSAAKMKMLTADKYHMWIETLVQSGDLKKAAKVCKTSLKDFPDCALLWLQYFKLKITEEAGFTGHLLEEFFQALKQVDCEGILSLWNLWLGHPLFLDLPETETVFQECVANCDSNEIKTTMKETYIELVVTKHGVKRGRKVYQRLCKEKPTSISFYKKCIAVENSQVIPSVKFLRQLYETALDEFGAAAPGLWLDYIQMEIQHGNSEVVGKLHWKAMKTLSGSNVEEFLTKYTLLTHSLS